MYPILFYTLENFSTKMFMYIKIACTFYCVVFFYVAKFTISFACVYGNTCMKRVSEDCIVKSELYIYCRALNKQRSNNGFFQGHLKDLIRVLVTNHDYKNQVVC